MIIPRKVYKVSFGEMSHDKKEEWDSPHTTSKVVLAETAPRAAEIATNLLSKSERKTYYVSAIELREEFLDSD